MKNPEVKFYEEIECEHGWTDGLGFAHCQLGSGCSIDLESYCVKEDCPIYEEDEDSPIDEDEQLYK